MTKRTFLENVHLVLYCKLFFLSVLFDFLCFFWCWCHRITNKTSCTMFCFYSSWPGFYFLLWFNKCITNIWTKLTYRNISNVLWICMHSVWQANTELYYAFLFDRRMLNFINVSPPPPPQKSYYNTIFLEFSYDKDSVIFMYFLSWNRIKSILKSGPFKCSLFGNTNCHLQPIGGGGGGKGEPCLWGYLEYRKYLLVIWFSLICNTCSLAWKQTNQPKPNMSL